MCGQSYKNKCGKIGWYESQQFASAIPQRYTVIDICDLYITFEKCLSIELIDILVL
jgi:hypothetical protein